MPDLAPIAPILDRLPFTLDDVDAVNACYVRCVETAAPDARRTVDMWTYAFAYRYFARKTTKGDLDGPDLEQLVGTAYERVQRYRDTVRDPGAYGQWVSVVCRNAFLNHVRTRAEHASIDAGEAPEPLDEHAAAAHELPFVHEAVDAAFAALPNYLEDVARLYFLDGYAYAEIADRLGKSVPTLRAYKQRIVKQLRDDPGLSTFLGAPGHES